VQNSQSPITADVRTVINIAYSKLQVPYIKFASHRVPTSIPMLFSRTTSLLKIQSSTSYLATDWFGWRKIMGISRCGSRSSPLVFQTLIELLVRLFHQQLALAGEL
jgi:hypothetical protein